MIPQLDKKKIVDSIARVARQLGHTPSKAEFHSHSGISDYFVLQFFRTWSEAVRAAGLEPYTVNARVEDRVLLEDWGKVVRRNRGVPPRHIYRREGKFNPGTLQKRFGGYSSMPQAFRNFVKGKRQWRDVLALLPGAEHGERRWRRETNGTSAILFNKNDSPGGINRQSHRTELQRLPERVRSAALKGRAMCGNPIEFLWLRHEPVNELGVVLLFGMLARNLGYIIEGIQNGFPDCEAKRQIAPDRWQSVNIEFEFESRNFRGHGHPVSGCDVIVCWHHNWHDCPEQIEVLELSRVIRSLTNAEA